MKRRYRIVGFLLVSVFVLTIIWLWSSNVDLPPRPEFSKRLESTPAASTSPSVPGTADESRYDERLARKGFEAIYEGLKRMGMRELPAAKKYLEDAAATGDKGRVLRAVHDVICSPTIWKLDEAIPALEACLKFPDPYVRYAAAEALFTVGVRSGYSTLIELVQADEPIEGLGRDVRIEAAATLAKFRETSAAPAIYELYQRTRSGALIAALSLLQAEQAPSLVGSRGFFPESSAMRYYALNNSTNLIPQIKSTFYSTRRPDVKVASAYALAAMSGSPEAISYLVDVVESGNEPQGQGGYRDSVRYLGALQVPQAKETLEAALDSKDSTTVQVAAVNLIFNQGGSSKVNHMVAAELQGEPTPLGTDLALNLAVQLRGDPAIESAGQAFARRNPGGSWELYTIERKNWPIYNWVDNFVVRLNR